MHGQIFMLMVQLLRYRKMLNVLMMNLLMHLLKSLRQMIYFKVGSVIKPN